VSTAYSSALHKAALAVFYEATRTQQAQAAAKRRAAIRRAQAAFAALFRRQGRLFLERLPKLASYFIVKEAAYDGDLVDAFADVFGKTRKQAEKALVDSLFDGLSLGYTTQATQFGIEQSFKIGSKRAVEWARQNAAARISGIEDTTKEAVRNLIRDGIEKGRSYGEVARDLRSPEFGAFSKQRAETIAVTENAYSYEQGSRSLVDDIEAVGIKMEKQWSTVGGDACEEICGPNEAEGWIAADDAFQSGDMQPPGHPNCRCTTLYRVAEG
jgi:hypothetical protein